jgi:hypothetical protein
MEELRVQISHARRLSGSASHLSSVSDFRLQNTLAELGRSLYHNRVVPGSPEASPSASDDRLRGWQHNPPVRHHGGQGNTRPTARNSYAHTTSVASSTSRPPSPIRQLRRVSERRSSPSPRSNPGASHLEVTIEPRLFNNRTLRFRKEEVEESIDGYVGNRRTVLRHTTASLVGALEGNIISIGKARELDLKIEHVEPNRTALFDFGTGRHERSIGKVVLQWHPSSPETNPRLSPLTVTCDVCENSTVGLILGKPFVEERARRWRRSGATSRS